MRVLVTGAAGFIGSAVSEGLLARGDEVVGLDNFNAYYDPAIKEGNVAEVEAAAAQVGGRFRLVRADVTDPARMSAVFADPGTRPDVVCHLAAWAGVRPSIADPLRYTSTNVDGTTQLLELCRAHDIRPFVFASSSSVYGARKQVPFHEEDRVDDPISPYAATKKAGELIGHTYHHLHGTRFVALRFFTVYGPRQRPEMAIHLFAKKILAGEAVTLFGDGSSSRDYTFVDDVTAGVLAAIDRAAFVDGYRVYNLGCGRTTRLSELVELIAKAAGKRAHIRHAEEQPGDVPTTYASVERAREELGYRPDTPPAVGIPKFVEWLRRRGLAGA